MKTITCETPSQFIYKEAPIPKLSDGQLLIQIKRIGICGTDLHAYKGTQPYFNYPRILGHELAGIVIDNNNSEIYNNGDQVTIIPYLSCGHCIACQNSKENCCVNLCVLGVHTDGGMQEYISVPQTAIISSTKLDLDTLALIEPFSIGAHGIKRAQIVKDEYVLVVGAGMIGLGAMEFARLAGGQVIAMDTNDQRLDFSKNTASVKYTINPLTDEVDEVLKKITNGNMPTIVIDATGNQQAINKNLKYLAHGGKYILIGLQKNEIIFSHPEFHKRETTLMSSRNANRNDFEFVIECIEHKLINPNAYITHRVKFENLKNEFNDYYDSASGIIKVLINMD